MIQRCLHDIVPPAGSPFFSIRRIVRHAYRSSFGLLALLGLAALPLRAANFTVTTTADSGVGSLRDAISQANTDPDADTITFDPALTTGQVAFITIASGEMLIDSDLTITGPSANLLTVSGDNASRIFRINAGRAVAVSGMTMTAGMPGTFFAANGGAIENEGSLSIDACVFTGNSSGMNMFAQGGGAIHNGYGCTLAISRSTFTGNTTGLYNQGGGAILNNGDLAISASTFSGNYTGSENQGGGGAIFNDASVTIIDSTFTGNFTGTGINNYGSVISQYGGTSVKITNSTISGNTDDSGSSRSSAIANIYGSVVLVQSTVVGNAPAGLVNEGNNNPTYATAQLVNSIVAGNGAADITQNGPGGFSDNGANFIGEPGAVSLTFSTKTFASTNTTIDQVIDPLLADNGGPTQTHALVAGSPALNAGIDADAVNAAGAPLLNDQRDAGFPRKLGAVDLGAFEAPGAPKIAVADPDAALLETGAIVNWGGQILETTGATKTFTIKNTGGTALNITSVSVVGDDVDDFIVDAADLLTEVPATTGTTTLTVTFTPTALGARTTTLRIESDDADEGAFDIVLQGTGLAVPTRDFSAFTTGRHAADIDVLAGLIGTPTITVLTQPQFGTVTVVNGKIHFTPRGLLPNAGDSFTYLTDDGLGGIITGTIRIVNFTDISGEYDGLIKSSGKDTDGGRHRKSGHLRLSLSKTGAFTGALTFGGTKLNPVGQVNALRYSFMERFDSAGNATRIIQRLGLPPITFTLHFDAETRTITGTAAALDGITPFTSELALALRTPAGENAGTYPVQITPGFFITVLGNSNTPQTSGTASIRVAASGNVTIVGRLGDGAAFSTTAFLHDDLTFPLYAILYNGNAAARGSLRGSVPLLRQITVRAIAPPLEWFKPARPLDATFPMGFDIDAYVQFQMNAK